MFSKIKQIIQNASKWVTNTPERAIENAYQAAVSIKKIEDEYFKGEVISDQFSYSENTYSLFKIQLQSKLNIIDTRLAEYKISARFPNFLSANSLALNDKLLVDPNLQETNASTLQKLAFIDFILLRYRLQPTAQTIELKSEIVPLLDTNSLDPKEENKGKHRRKFILFPTESNQPQPDKVVPIEKSVIPGSVLRSLDRIWRNLTSGYGSYERDVVDELRYSRKRTNVAIRYVLIVIIITITTQQLSKNLIYSPLINNWNNNGRIEVRFNLEYEEEAINKFRLAKEKLEFERLIGETINTSDEMTDESLKKEAINIVQFYKNASLEGIKNLLADITASFAFYSLIVLGKKQVQILREFIDEVFFSLNDSAKAFLIIASTDIFVGYHSSDGWEALLNSLLRHFGLPENRTLILTFIATVPVFLDALFKFWIFQYLRRSSPSTAAIYREMDE